MKKLVSNTITIKDMNSVLYNECIDWEKFKNKTIFITGATGTIGSFFIQTLLKASHQLALNITIIGGVRNIKNAKQFFCNELSLYSKNFKLIKYDLSKKIKCNKKIDYIVHTANNTSSKSFVEKPVETLDVGVQGTKNVLQFAKEKKVKSFIFLSSMEVYGEIDEAKPLKEQDLGKLNLNEVRNSYPVAKRTAEMLCASFAKEYKLPVKIARLAQIIGANVDYNDSRVYAQFARSIVEKKDIILNTPAETTRSYCYISDLISALLLILIKGQNGETYNVSNENAIIKIKDMAKMLTDRSDDSNLIFDIKDNTPYFKQTHWILDNSKLKSLGWIAQVDINDMYKRLIAAFYEQKNASLLQKSAKHKKREKKYNFIENIFSIKNNGQSKIIRILGLSFEFSRADFVKKYYKLPIQNNKIVFCNYTGKGYGCNPKYIADEIIKRGLNYDLVWLLRDADKKDEIPSQIRVVNYKSQEAMKELITAKVWVDNYHKIAKIKNGLEKRDGQIYIQTWHGSLGIKKIEKQVNCLTKDKQWEGFAIKNSHMTDYWISNSKFETFVYNDSFWDVKNIKEFGHPRNDIFFKDSQNIKNKIKKFYNISDDKSIMLYAPSFREDESLRYYQIMYENLIKALEEKTNKKWVVLLRLHPRLANFSSYLVKNQKNVIDTSDYSDIQELLVSADSMITDYSSCIFDFMLSRKPAFIFANDIADYNQERGFYYPLESTPFPIASDNYQLFENIKNFDNDKYQKEVQEFLKDKGCIEDGNASKRVVDLIGEIL